MEQLVLSISGTRGVVGSTLTPELALKTGKAFGAYLGKGPVIIGCDTRTSGDMLKAAVVAGLTSVGIDIIDIGIVPTPTVQQAILHHKANGGIVITASHNPQIWNGIKLMSSEGSFLNEAQYAEYNTFYAKPDTAKLSDWQTVGKVTVDTTAIDVHIDRVLSVIDPEPIRKSGLKVLIDPNNGTGCVANPKLFARLGVQYDMLHAEPTGIFSHSPEPLKENVSAIMERMKQGGYDIGFIQDADADRLVVLAEDGTFIGEDNSLGISIDHILQIDPTPNKTVVVNLSTSNVIKDIADRYGATLYYTKIGEANVTEKMKAINATVGGEGNGGVMYPAIGWGRDSLAGMTIALHYLATSKKKVSDIVATFPKYVMLRDKIQLTSRDQVGTLLESAKKAFPTTPADELDGLKFMMGDRWLHIRPSNTEPIVRVFIEAPDMAAAEALKAQLMAQVAVSV